MVPRLNPTPTPPPPPPPPSSGQLTPGLASRGTVSLVCYCVRGAKPADSVGYSEGQAGRRLGSLASCWGSEPRPAWSVKPCQMEPFQQQWEPLCCGWKVQAGRYGDVAGQLFIWDQQVWKRPRHLLFLTRDILGSFSASRWFFFPKKPLIAWFSRLRCHQPCPQRPSSKPTL